MPSKQYNSEYYKKNKDRLDSSNSEYIRKRKQTDSEYRERKRQQARASQQRRRDKHKEIKIRAKDKPCVDCGRHLPPEIMEFDHVRGEKLFNICQSYGGKKYVSYKMLQDEIDKCDIRCPTCHRLRHYNEDNGQEAHNIWRTRSGYSGSD